MQFDTEIQAKKDFDEGQQPKDIYEKYFEKNEQSSVPQNLKMSQADLEVIRSETTTDGESKVFFSSDDYIRNCSLRQNGRK